MPDITNYLAQILAAKYGKDVRSAIHSSIQECYNDGKAGAIDLIARAKIGKGPDGVYPTFAALASANPDHGGVYLVTADGKWYWWNGTAFVAGGVYQATSNQGQVDDIFAATMSASINLIGPDVFNGAIIIGSGVFVPNTSNHTYDEWWATDYIPVVPGLKYTFGYNGTEAIPSTGAFYTSAKAYLSDAAFPGGICTAPASSAYIRVSKDTGSTDSILLLPYQLEQGDIATAYVANTYNKALVQGDNAWNELVECDNIPGYYTNGTLVYNYEGGAYDFVTKVYDVSNIDTVKLSGTIVAYVSAYTLLDSTRTVMSYKAITWTDRTFADGKISVVGASFIAISSSYLYHSGVSGIRLYGYGSIESRWKNKKIVWFGTSIPAGDLDGFSYPELVGKKLGATVYNEAIGSSPVHSRQFSRVSATNPYGFRADFEAAVRALSNGTLMTQWICNWADYYCNGGVYANGEAWDATVFTSSLPATFDAADEAYYLGCSFQSKLLQYLTDATFPDLFVFDHGFNDIMTDEALYDSQFATYRRYNAFTFRGAMNYLIDTIIAFRHDAKIIMIGTNDKYRTGHTDTHTNQLIIADEYELPILKLWEYSMFSQVTVDMYGHNTANGVWLKTAATTNQSIYNAFMPDTVHPHSDKSGGCTRRIADIIMPFIDAC